MEQVIVRDLVTCSLGLGVHNLMSTKYVSLMTIWNLLRLMGSSHSTRNYQWYCIQLTSITRAKWNGVTKSDVCLCSQMEIRWTYQDNVFGNEVMVLKHSISHYNTNELPDKFFWSNSLTTTPPATLPLPLHQSECIEERLSRYCARWSFE